MSKRSKGRNAPTLQQVQATLDTLRLTCGDAIAESVVHPDWCETMGGPNAVPAGTIKPKNYGRVIKACNRLLVQHEIDERKEKHTAECIALLPQIKELLPKLPAEWVAKLCRKHAHNPDASVTDIDDVRPVFLPAILVSCKELMEATAKLEIAGKEIAAQFEIAEKLETQAKQFVNHWITVGERLDAAKKLCVAAGVKFDDFQQQYAPGYSKSRINDLIRIGRGEAQAVLGGAAKRQAKHRKKLKDAAAVTNGQATPRITGNDEDPAASAERMKAAHAGEAPPVTPQWQETIAKEVAAAPARAELEQPVKLSATPVQAFKNAVDSVAAILADRPPEEARDDALHCLKIASMAFGPLMSEAELKHFRVYFTEGKWRPKTTTRKAA